MKEREARMALASYGITRDSHQLEMIDLAFMNGTVTQRSGDDMVTVTWDESAGFHVIKKPAGRGNDKSRG